MSSWEDKVYVISDIHFFYNKLLESRKEYGLDTNYNNDKFVDYIIKNWNETVPKDGIVLFLGDLTYKHSNYINDYDRNKEIREYINALKIIKKCNGSKIWILGNHERKFLNNIKDISYSRDKVLVKEFWKTYKESFSNVEENPIQIDNYIFSHEPLVNIQENIINFHGHIHLGEIYNLMKNSKRHFNVNVEFTGYKPVSINIKKN